VHPWNHVSGGLSDKSGKPGLSGGVANRLSKRRCRNRHPNTEFGGARDKCNHTAIVAIEGNQPTRV